MEQKYRVLRFIGGMYFVLGVLVLILGTGAAFGTAVLSTPAFAYGMTPNVGGTSPINLFVGVVMEVGVLVVGFGLVAGAQLIQLLRSVEENTRATAESQNEQLRLLKMQPPQSGQRF